LEGRERDGRHHELGCASWDRSRGAETKGSRSRTARHCSVYSRKTVNARLCVRDLDLLDRRNGKDLSFEKNDN
jgi:hypothetical protein